MVDKPYPAIDNFDTIILIDGGYFVFRMTKHWSKKGRMFKAHQKFKAKKINYFQRRHHFKKAIEADISYIGFRLGEMKKNPKYESSCMVIVCYDGIKGRQKRGQLHSLYKANRYGAEEDYDAKNHEGVDIREKLSKMSLEPENLEKRWFSMYDEWSEGDDLLGELTAHCLNLRKEVIVMSSDSDMIQLLDYEGVVLHNFTKLINSNDIEMEYGIKPNQYIDYKALCGDVSDNIGGVPFIGKTNAKKLVLKYGSIEEIPLELLRVYHHGENLMDFLIEYRKENELSLKQCKSKFGSFWEKIELGESVVLSPSHIKKLSGLDIEKYLIPIEYKEQALIWKKLITIPFKYRE